MSEAFLIDVTRGEGTRHPARLGAVIGREDCEILILDPEVSRRHAAIRGVDGRFGVEDLGSANGTSVNGERLDGIRVLRDGDQLRVGDTILRFESVRGPVASGLGAQDQARGDVPAPEAVPSVVRRAPPLERSEPPAFTPTARPVIRGSAARRIEATAISYAVILVTAVTLGIYFATR